ncbi:MAG: restriction endonuclease [Candidatus Binatia bacterium]
MTAFNSPKPIEPKPEDFNLTQGRTGRFRDPFDVTEWWFILTVLLLSVLAAAVVFVVDGNFFNSLLTFAVSLIFAMKMSTIVDAIWRRCQPDYAKYQSFKTALESYEKRLQQWRREQTVWWQSLSGRGFESELGRLFERRGYQTRRLGGARDEGIDLVLRKDGKEVLVQCKAHGRPVGPGAVRDLYGVMMHKRAVEAWLISTMGFSQAAKKFAAGKPLRLIRIEEILRETS